MESKASALGAFAKAKSLDSKITIDVMESKASALGAFAKAKALDSKITILIEVPPYHLTRFVCSQYDHYMHDWLK
jgi:hypothetical protein